MWSDFNIYFQNLEEDQACLQALDCLEVFGTPGGTQDDLDQLMGDLYGADDAFGFPVEEYDDSLAAMDPIEDMEEEEACERALNQFEFQHNLAEQSGGALGGDQPGRIDFTLQPFVDRRSERMGLHERHFTTRMTQTGNFIPQQNITTELEQGLQRAMNNVLDDNMNPRDRLFFAVSSDRLTPNFQGWGLTAGEWRNGGDRVDALFQRLANSLNSNENFELNDTFKVSITHARHGPNGTGHPRKRKPKHKATETLRLQKKSVIRIKNRDLLCCARALVTAKAKLEQPQHWENIRKGRPRQTKLAEELHANAGVAFGACGYQELQTFQNHLADFEIILVDAERGYTATSFNPGSGKPKLALLYDKEHYDTITSLAGFFGTSYFCNRCLKGYNNEGKHACKKNKTFCRACRRQTCQDFNHANGLKATRPCHLCRRKFFGEQCFEAHLVLDNQGKNNPEQSICQTVKRCKLCFKLETGKDKIKRHKCGHAFCPSCHFYVDIASHRCFVLPPMKRKRKGKESKNKRARLEEDIESEPEISDNEDDEEEEDEEEEVELTVYFDIEAMQLASKHEANLLVCETDDSDEPIIFKGLQCVVEFLEYLEELAADDTNKVTVIAHNFQGYDGYFVIHEYHGRNQLIQQLRNGSKILQLKHDSIRFIDSVNFIAGKLSNFTKTFGLTELKKGYFPHLFNLPENQEYVGEVPAMDYNMVEGMSPKDFKSFN